MVKSNLVTGGQTQRGDPVVVLDGDWGEALGIGGAHQSLHHF